jgi:hypothetical protein
MFRADLLFFMISYWSMGDKYHIEILKEALRSDDAPPLTDETVDALLSQAEPPSQETIDIMVKKHAKRAFAQLHKRPVLHIEEKRTAGRWLEEKIKDAIMTVPDFARATGISKSRLEKLIAGKVLPWEIEVKDFSEIVCTVNIHIKAVTELAERSLAVSQEYERSRDLKPYPLKGRPEDKDPDVRKALDATFAEELPEVELSDEVQEWLSKLREELEKRQAIHLLQ